MKIFVTLGTTPFDSLVKYIDEHLSQMDVTIQTLGDYVPVNHHSFSFVDNINDYYEIADVVITHAGAGSVYQLLELNKKIIVVPNFERVDNHQSDISKFVEDNNYALVAWTVDAVISCIHDMKSGVSFSDYKKDNFFKYKEISLFIDN